jgi:hypothetical protein
MDVELFTTNASYVKDGSIGASFGRGIFSLTVTEDARTKKEQTLSQTFTSVGGTGTPVTTKETPVSSASASGKGADGGGAASVKSGQPPVVE